MASKLLLPGAGPGKFAVPRKRVLPFTPRELDPAHRLITLPSSGFHEYLLEPGEDALILGPESGLFTGRLAVKGGRRVHARAISAKPASGEGREFQFQNQEEEIAIEGCDLHCNMLNMDAIDAAGSPNAPYVHIPDVIIQATRLAGMFGEAGSKYHADGHQPQGAINRLLIAYVTIYGCYQALFEAAQAPMAYRDIRYVNAGYYEGIDNGYHYWFDGGGTGSNANGIPNWNPVPTNLHGVYSQQGTSSRNMEHRVWQGGSSAEHKDASGNVLELHTDDGEFYYFDERTLINGGIHDGAPEGGDFVKAGEVGAGYVPWGYAE